MVSKNEKPLVGFASPIRVLTITAVAMIAAGLFCLLPWREELVTRFARPFEFKFRHFVGKDPQIDPRIKIYALGDSTLEFLGSSDLPLSDWEKVFTTLSKSNPKAVFVDKLFSTPKGKEDAERFSKVMKSFNFPIVTAAFVTSVPVSGRQALTLEDEKYEVEKVFGATAATELERFGETKFAYGPSKMIEDAFRHLGHIIYNGDNYISPLFRIDAKHVLPSAPLMIANERKFLDNELIVDGHVVPLSRDNQILVNLGPPKSYSQNMYAMKSLIINARDGKTLDTLPKDAVVLILPGMYTGGTDFVQTSYGIMPGGYVMTAMINSVLTGNWLKISKTPILLPVLCALLAALMAFSLQSGAFVLFSGLGVAVIIGSGLVSFAYLGYAMPWLFSTFGFLIGGGIAFADKNRRAEIDQQKLAKDIDLGSWAQMLFLPERWEEKIEATRYKIVFEPFGPMSGDWVQIYSSPETIVLAIGDVVGKGPSAALNTAVIASVWCRHKESWENVEPNINAFITDLNSTIFRLFKGKQFTTLSIAILDRERVRLFCFGAPTWLIVTKSGEVESVSLPARNPIGMSSKEPTVGHKELHLGADRVLVGYSDGVIDGPAARRRLKDLLAQGDDALDFSNIEAKMRSAGAADREPDDFTLLMIASDKLAMNKSA